jgi:hypothetical protein
MENGRKEVAARFAKVLRDKLTERFGDMPSAARVANHFNLRAHGTGAITTEAARRWIKGLSVPELARFRVLSDWLGISTSDFIELASVDMPQESRPPSAGLSLVGKLGNEAELLSYVIEQGDLGEAEEKNFLRLFKLLSSSERDGILIAVWALLRVQQGAARRD